MVTAIDPENNTENNVIDPENNTENNDIGPNAARVHSASWYAFAAMVIGIAFAISHCAVEYVKTTQQCKIEALKLNRTPQDINGIC